MSDPPTTQSLFEVAGLGRSFLTGAAIGFTSMAVLTFSLTFLAGIDLGICLAMAAFTAAFAGLGLGGMFGAIRSTHHLR